MKRREGFTLIELMIVVAIMGILVTIAIPNFVRMTGRARETKVKNGAHMLQLAAEDYAVRNEGVYSAAAADLGPLLPQDPQGGNNLENAFSGNFDQPLWGAAAANAGEVGIVDLQDGAGVRVGYEITGFGKDEVVIELRNGNP